MNRWLLNNEIICTLLRIHQKYFSSDKYSVDIFNAYMQEVNLFYNFQFILLTFLFRARCINRKFQLQDLWSCALAWWCQKNHRTSHNYTGVPLPTKRGISLIILKLMKILQRDLNRSTFVV